MQKKLLLLILLLSAVFASAEYEFYDGSEAGITKDCFEKCVSAGLGEYAIKTTEYIAPVTLTLGVGESGTASLGTLGDYTVTVDAAEVAGTVGKATITVAKGDSSTQVTLSSSNKKADFSGAVFELNSVGVGDTATVTMVVNKDPNPIGYVKAECPDYCAHPTPTVTAEPTPTPIEPTPIPPTPTVTIAPTPEPVPTVTAEPRPKPTPTEAPTPTVTAEPEKPVEEVRAYRAVLEKLKTRPAPTVVGVAVPTTTTPIATPIPMQGPCYHLRKTNEKIAFYEKISGLAEEKLRSRGYAKDEVQQIIKKLKARIKGLQTACEASTKPKLPILSSGGGAVAIAVPVPEVEAVEEVIAPTETVEVAVHYKQRLEKILEKEADPTAQIKALKQLRKQIDKMIVELIKAQEEVNVEEVMRLTEEITVSSTEIKVGEEVLAADKSFTTTVAGEEVTLEKAEEAVYLHAGEKKLKVVPAVALSADGMAIAGKALKVKPSEIMNREHVQEVAIEEAEGSVVYRVQKKKPVLLFWFIPIDMEGEEDIDIESGEVVRQRMPWWRIFTAG